ncbi:MAG: hypothetical protein ACYTHN_14260 [Planctomycetota bacterium]|jgi:hypothetical protein
MSERKIQIVKENANFDRQGSREPPRFRRYEIPDGRVRMMGIQEEDEILGNDPPKDDHRVSRGIRGGAVPENHPGLRTGWLQPAHQGDPESHVKT